jgi:two-component system LytT family response regulator
MSLSCLIIDDEPLARALLADMLDDHDDIEIVGECESGRAALDHIRADPPDLIFLDVQMPGLDGFELLRALRGGPIPEVIFVTAFDQYALKAFEVHALDYLLKPFDEDRLAAALDRARQHLRRPDRALDAERIVALIEQLRTQDRHISRLVIREGERSFLQNVDEIDWLEADGKFVKVHVGDRYYTIRESLKRLQGLLDPERFLRISRSAIINLDRVRDITPWFHGDVMVRMRSGAEVPTTRSYRDQLKRILNEGA